MPKLLNDLLTNDRGYYSSNSVMRMGSYLVALTASVWLIYHRPELSLTIVLMNYALAYGLSAAKIWETFMSRKTADQDGPLLQDGTQTAPAAPVIPAVEADQKVATAADAEPL